MSRSKNSNGLGWKVAGSFVCVLITVITSLSLFITTGLRGDIARIDSRLFDHLTNEELHIQRDQVVTKAQFDLYCGFEDQKKEALLDKLEEIKEELARYMSLSKGR